MADIEKARMIVRNLRQMADDASRSRASGPWLSAVGAAEEALRALDGDGAEEWRARPDGYGLWAIDGPCATVIARDLIESEARRIARLPALERAVATAVTHWRHGKHVSMDDMDALDAAFAALNQEGQ